MLYLRRVAPARWRSVATIAAERNVTDRVDVGSTVWFPISLNHSSPLKLLIGERYRSLQSLKIGDTVVESRGLVDVENARDSSTPQHEQQKFKYVVAERKFKTSADNMVDRKLDALEVAINKTGTHIG